MTSLSHQVSSLNQQRVTPVFFSIFLLFFTTHCTNKIQTSHRAVVNVNGHVLEASVFADQLAEKLKHLDALRAKDPSIVQQAKDNLIRDFIIDVITEKWAQENGIFVRAEDIENETSAILKKYPDKLSFEKILADQNLTYATWKDQMTKTLLQRMVAKKLRSQLIEPSEEEMKMYYLHNKEQFERPEQVRLRQIVVATEADAKLMEDQLKRGKSLAELAEKHSITPEGKLAKGQLGWLEKGIMEGFDQAFSMRVGSRSPIFKSPYGYHIFEVLEKRPAQTQPYQRVQPKIKQNLLSLREQTQFTSWLESELRKVRVLKDEELLRNIKIQTQGD